MASKRVLVIGAGVIGLQTSVLLLEAGYNVTILAKHFPGDTSIEYTSPWAGAQWRSHAQEADARQCRWDLETYLEWLKIIDDENSQEIAVELRSGLSLVPDVLLWDSIDHHELKPRGVKSLWFMNHVQGFEELDPSKHNLPPGVAAAARFISITVDVPKFLNYLFEKFHRLGGVAVKAELSLEDDLNTKLDTAAKILRQEYAGNCKNGQYGGNLDVAAFVNCTGIAAREFVRDEGVFPIRGQTIVVRGEASQITTRQGTDFETGAEYISYVVPRKGSNTTLIGGSKDKGDWSRNVDLLLNEKIIQRCGILCPELLTGKGKNTFDVLATQIGFRPGRTGGARVEEENVQGKVLIHAYGHGGAGYQNSFGCAKDVRDMVQKSIGGGLGV